MQSEKLSESSCHIQNFLIGIEYRNCRRTLDVYSLFAIWMGQIQSKLIYIDWPVCKLHVCNLVFNKFAQAK